MKCPNCRKAEMLETRGVHQYAESGLPNIRIRNVRIRRCPSCDEQLVSIPNIEGLHSAIASLVLRKRARLAPPEIAFLRKYLGLSNNDFARLMGVDPATTSRWVSGAQVMAPTADRLLRALASNMQPVEDYNLHDQLMEIEDRDEAPAPIEAEQSGGGWQLAI